MQLRSASLALAAALDGTMLFFAGNSYAINQTICRGMRIN